MARKKAKLPEVEITEDLDGGHIITFRGEHATRLLEIAKSYNVDPEELANIIIRAWIRMDEKDRGE